ncbi:MAG: DNA primase [Pirellulales bacterium]|nr:DNA primase [Pirellulales bacterium]
MSGEFSLDAKEQVREATDIVDLVGSYLQLQRKGRAYVALCPWHDDSRPSLQVNPERQSFKCWVCDIGGDVFSFIMKMEGVEFREALEMLAERAGIELKPHRPYSPGKFSADPELAEALDEAAPTGPDPIDKKTLYRAAAWVEAQYHRCLCEAPEAEPARQYLKRRGITDESIEAFHLGFAPDRSGWILEQAEGGSGRAKVLEAIGALAARDDGSHYDRFRGRLLFSIRDVQGRPVGLGGRVLPETSSAASPAKYVNSPETPLFSKSNLLYGLDLAKEAIRRDENKTVLVMEGYTDCIVAHQHGFTNAVAVLGTALGQQHVKILQRYADRVVLVLDGDEAGQRRANEVLDLFIAQQVDLRILTLPAGADPCDFLQDNGAEAFQSLLDNEAVDALDHALRAVTQGVDLANDVHAASEALEKMVALLARAPRPSGQARFREEKVLSRLARVFGVAETDIRARLSQIRRRMRPGSFSPREDGPSDEPPVRLAELRRAVPGQCELIELIMADSGLLDRAREVFQSEHLTSAPCRRIFETCCRLADEGRVPTPDRLMLEFDEPAMKSLLVELDESCPTAEAVDRAALLEELIQRFKQRQADRQLPGQVAALKDEGLNESQKEDLLHKMMEQLRARHGISEPTDG